MLNMSNVNNVQITYNNSFWNLFVNEKLICGNLTDYILPDSADVNSEILIYNIKKGEFWGLCKISKDEILIPNFWYDSPVFFDGPDGVATYERGGKYGLIDKNLKHITGAIYEDISFGDNDLICARILDNQSYKSGYINSKGEIVIPFKFMNAWKFKNGVALVRFQEPKCWQLINNNGIVIEDNLSMSKLYKNKVRK